MFNIQGSELIFLLLIALVILGPEKLPDAVRKFGRTYAEFKKFSAGFQGELRQALDEPMRELRDTADAVRVAANFDFDADTDVEASDAGGTGEQRSRAKAAGDAMRPGAGAVRPTLKAERSTPLNFGDPTARAKAAGAQIGKPSADNNTGGNGATTDSAPAPSSDTVEDATE